MFVLCFFVSNNNFVQKLLKQVLDETKEEINNTLGTYQEIIRELRIMEFYLKNLMTDGTENEKKEEVVRLLNRASLYRMSYENEGNRHKEKLKKLYDSIKNGDEFLASFLYTFLFCMVIFICDELYSPRTVLGTYTLVFTFIFTVISYFIWFFKWIYYWTHINMRDAGKPRHRYHFMLPLFFLLAIVPSVVSCALTAVMERNFPETSVLHCAIMFYLLVVLVMGSFAIVMFWNNAYRFTANFVIKHFVCVVISVLFFCVGVELFFYPVGDFAADVVFIRRMVLGFTLINGFILPFVVPFYRMQVNSGEIQKDIQRHITEYGLDIKKIKEECDNFKRSNTL